MRVEKREKEREKEMMSKIGGRIGEGREKTLTTSNENSRKRAKRGKKSHKRRTER